MITEQETKKYEVNTFRMIESSFSSAFDTVSDAPVVSPPEKSVTVTGIISMILVAGMCGLTYYETKSAVWLVVGGAALALIALIVYRYIKASNKYKKANEAGSVKFDYKNEYMSLFPELPGRMNAGDFIRAVSPLQNKMPKDVYNNALRDLITKLNTVNNPQDVICRNLTTYGELLSRPRKRCYICSSDSDIVIYDADCLDPQGELVLDSSDVVSYGTPDKYGDKLAAVKKAGTKIGGDAIIIAVKTGEDGGTLYLESHANDIEKIRKLFGKGRQL